ncbi:rifin [Plasmodium falciparum IGH-CR14]|uniref:Rifin n=1 Tax=Plasmodium falciparum IGH-CR14 TaxID=580059 RepID=A0A0L1I3K1_PLAFA|nr:rifin [Plasmodium falciparum IGH-CR14]
MKIHYTNILLFPLKLNILVNTHKKPHTTARHTQKIPTTRSLSECELFAPQNYDNDPEMKSVMQQFHDRTTQRFQEYDERLQERRQICKDTCDKEIQKIILKDKLEKELTEKFATLQTDIHSDAIPTCICEKSLADKVEKTCLKCTQNLGGIVAPSSGVLAGIAEGALYAWKPKALDAAIAKAITEGTADIAAAGVKAGEVTGKEFVIAGLEKLGISTLDGKDLGTYFATTHYKNVASIAQAVNKQYLQTCVKDSLGKGFLRFADGNRDIPFCNSVWEQTQAVSQRGQYISHIDGIRTAVETMMSEAEGTAKAAAEAARESATNAIKARETGLINAIFMSKQTAIIASVVAILFNECKLYIYFYNF